MGALNSHFHDVDICFYTLAVGNRRNGSHGDHELVYAKDSEHTELHWNSVRSRGCYISGGINFAIDVREHSLSAMIFAQMMCSKELK